MNDKKEEKAKIDKKDRFLQQQNSKYPNNKDVLGVMSSRITDQKIAEKIECDKAEQKGSLSKHNNKIQQSEALKKL